MKQLLDAQKDNLQKITCNCAWCTALPKPPTGLVVSQVSAVSVKLSWNSGNTDPVTSYTILYRPKSVKERATKT